MATPGPRFTGFFNDIVNARAALYYKGTLAIRYTASAVTHALATTFSAAVTLAGATSFTSRLSAGSTGIFGFGTGATATIASGVLTATKSYMIMDAEGAGTTDQLDSITGPGTPADGDLLLLVSNATDTITVDDANINLGAATRAVAPGGSLLLRYDGTEAQWTEVIFLAAADNV